MAYNNFGYNPYQMQMQQINGLTQVVGLAGAKAYQTPTNSTIPLFDANDAVFYVKTTDSFGNSNVRVFDFQERKSEDKPDYVTQEEFNVLDGKLNQLLEVLNGKSFIPEAPTATTDQSDNEPVQPTVPTRRRKPASSV